METKSFLPNFFSSLIVLFCLLATLNSHAQERGIFELENNNSNSASKTSQKKSSLKLDRDNFYELVFKLHPTIYLEKNKVKKTHESQKAALKITLSDVDSFKTLNSLGDKSEKVELIYITLTNPTDLNTTLDLSNLKGLNQLKYVYITCYFKCTSSDIEKMIKMDSNQKVRVFYKTETPS